MKLKLRPSIIRILVIILAVVLLFSQSDQTRQALAAENTHITAGQIEKRTNPSQETAQYNEIQLAGQVIALLVGGLFLLLAVAPFLLPQDQYQQIRSDICHFSNERL
jgi:hypothetical protein